MWHQPWAVQRSHQGRGYQCCKCQRSESDRQTQKPCGVTLGCQVAANFQLELFETLLDWTERTVPVHLRTIPITAFDITQKPPTPSKHPKQVPYANCGNFNQVQPSVLVIRDDTNPNCRILQSWQVVILMRHGDRTPVRERFGDLFQNISIFVSAMSEAIACNYIVFLYSKSLQQLQVRSHVEMVWWCFGRVEVVDGVSLWVAQVLDLFDIRRFGCITYGFCMDVLAAEQAGTSRDGFCAGRARGRWRIQQLLIICRRRLLGSWEHDMSQTESGTWWHHKRFAMSPLLTVSNTFLYWSWSCVGCSGNGHAPCLFAV